MEASKKHWRRRTCSSSVARIFGSAQHHCALLGRFCCTLGGVSWVAPGPMPLVGHSTAADQSGQAAPAASERGTPAHGPRHQMISVLAPSRPGPGRSNACGTSAALRWPCCFEQNREGSAPCTLSERPIRNRHPANHATSQERELVMASALNPSADGPTAFGMAGRRPGVGCAASSGPGAG